LRCPAGSTGRRRTPEGRNSAPSGLNSVPTAGPGELSMFRRANPLY